MSVSASQIEFRTLEARFPTAQLAHLPLGNEHGPDNQRDIECSSIEDVYVQNRRLWVRLHEKSGKRHEMPCHHNLEAFIYGHAIP
jgi:hypothetical protein